MSPLGVVGILFWTAVFSAVLAFAIDLNLRKILARYWKLIFLLLLSVVLWRMPANGRFFHGLEYEDSYVYTVAGRQLLSMPGDERAEIRDSYSVQVCRIGNLESCLSWESFPEHFIGYPYVIYLLSRIFGYSPQIGSVANVCAACLSDILIFGILILLTESSTTATAGAFVLALTPVFGVYGLETSAEPAANLFVTLCFWFFIRTIAENGIPWRRAIQWFAFSATLLFSLCIKRENALMVIVFGAFVPLIGAGAKLTTKARWIFSIGLFATTSVALTFCVQVGLIATSQSELELLKQFPVSVIGFLGFATSFLRSFFEWRWYAGTAYAVVVGAVVCVKRRGVALLPLLLVVSYVAVYAFHIRSYYEMRAGYVTPSAGLRFSMTFMSLWAILAGIGIGAVIIRLGRISILPSQRFRLGGIALMAILVVISFFMTRRLRDNMVDDENQSRIQAAVAAISAASTADTNPKFILTLEPLVIQMYGRPDTMVVDLESVNSSDLASLASSGYLIDAILIHELNRDSDADRTRYESQLHYLETLPLHAVFKARSFTIMKISP